MVKLRVMAGNTINMYGGSYVDVHDNEVVNLNIDKATVSVNDDTRPCLSGTPSNLEGEQRAEVLTENAEFMAIMQKAVEQGFCTQDGWQYRWKVKVEAAYFASLANERFKLSKRKINGKTAVSWIPFEALFGLNDLRTSFNDYKQCKTKLVREEDIDKLFE
jgi:hypothetical protein